MATLVAAALLACAAAPADDLRVGKLEQDVLELQRSVRQLERQIESLQRELAASRTTLAAPQAGVATSAPRAAATSPWLNQANWDRLRIGMPELEVIQILGPPNTMRSTAAAQARTLYYALEFESGGFLSGSVTVAGQRVSAIERPTLK